MKCINCGVDNDETLNFCINCGSPLVMGEDTPEKNIRIKRKKSDGKAGITIALLFFIPIILFGLFLLLLLILGSIE